ncbi:PhaM family polyhydroxyalkanoate granule multifunctional regulatory protein [Paraburkholderia sp. BL10I2N1]|uniref:PhaM family polyhydroxyalkanoate granule multifunctional regulatory protein n=1 Tax=Paraburkholderia sp. BL10I2N1 TaxID=1938796 RepID=UPI00105D4ABC|nr:PhaM family polyhydroxyalkanoate granule multifunctional regulatory protein [Paraburkholderia sp. BL10I2N1]TDN68335.1 hypothetical protein B0G77_1656 [Paraburkholderia sp. BL10I2N1]
MTDTPGTTPPFPGFAGFPPAELLDRMWDMMRLTPFGSAFPGAQPGGAQGLGPSLSMMSDMMAPLTNVEELDKRITDMRAVEQWLKLNLNMLQSAIQALEVQRATLATLRAFGAFAQTSMSAPAAASAATSTPSWMSRTEAPAAPAAGQAAPEAEPGETNETGSATEVPTFDTSAWWSLLQSQFNQLAQFAMAQTPAPGATATAEDIAEAAEGPDGPEASGAAKAPRAADASVAKKSAAAKRPATKRAPSAKSSTGTSAVKKAVPSSGA